VYVIDTGIYLANVEFEGRATWGTNTVDQTTTDGNGHGTHCAGTIGGRTYGMAKGVNLVAVKVLSDSGSGSTQGVISGIEWVVTNKGAFPAVGSMSLGGGKSTLLNAAVSTATEEGVVMVVAAGNNNAIA
jgi:subtilisin family serine protease